MNFVLLLILFVISGAIGLGYQVLWSKFLLQFIGISAWSYATILCVFMSGLAVGSQWLGKISDRLPCPLKFYCVLELGIGIYTILIYESLMSGAGDMYRMMARELLASDAPTLLLASIRAILAACVLFPPAIAMGATFPAVLKYAAREKENIGSRSAGLYAFNALGASAGALIMAFFLIPTMGLKASLMILGLGNLLLALMSFIIAKIWPFPKETGHTSVKEENPGSPEQNRWLLLVFISGFLSFTLEIGWTRFMVLVLGSTTYSFAVVLASFIFGIFLGSILLHFFVPRMKKSIVWFGLSLSITGILVLFSMIFYPFLPTISKTLLNLLSFDIQAFYLAELIKIMLSFAVMLPPTVFIGISIPLFLHLFADDVKRLGQISGRIYACNTWGNVLGALFGSLILLPLLGLETLFFLCALSYLLMGLYCLYQEDKNAYRVTMSLSAIAIMFSFLLPWDPLLFTVTPSRRNSEFQFNNIFADSIRQDKILFFEEDPAASVMVLEDIDPEDQTSSRLLFVNGKVDATDSGDMITQVLCAHTPLLMHNKPEDILIVGYGSGVTVGSALSHPIKSLEVVELIQKVIKASVYFEHVNQKPLEDPRTRLIVEDAASYLITTPKTYDVIISEPSNPWIAGIGSLFTLDFYELTKDRLREGGIFLQWLQAYEISDSTVFGILKTFRQVYPFVYVFHGRNNDLFLMGSQTPLNPSLSHISERMQQPEIAKNLKLAHCEDVFTLLSTQMFSPEKISLLAAHGQRLNTKDNLWLEHQAPMELFKKEYPTLLYRNDDRLYASPELFIHRFGLLRDQGIRLHQEFHNLVYSPKRNLQQQWMDALYSLYPHIPEIKNTWNDYITPLDNQQVLSLLTEYFANEQTNLANSLMEFRLSSILLQARLDANTEEFWLKGAKELTQKYGIRFPQVSLFYANLLISSKKPMEAAQVLINVVHPLPKQMAITFLHSCYLADPELFIEVIRVYLAHPDEFYKEMLLSYLPLMPLEMQRRGNLLL